jgi:hypothetical protein
MFASWNQIAECFRQLDVVRRGSRSCSTSGNGCVTRGIQRAVTEAIVRSDRLG